jgi:hypothetical protein
VSYGWDELCERSSVAVAEDCAEDCAGPPGDPEIVVAPNSVLGVALGEKLGEAVPP